MEKIAVFAGSFDPFTLGHYDITQRALGLFDRVYVAIGVNEGKRTLFPVESRLQLIRDVFRNEPRVSAEFYEGLTIDFCRRVGAMYMVRGLRSGTDFDYERTIAQATKMLAPDVETIFLVTRKEHAPIASTVVRDLLLHGHDVSLFLPEGVCIEDYPRNQW